MNSAVNNSHGQSLPCVHCGELTECSPDTSAAEVFCCSGCQNAYALIHGWGLEDFYALRGQMKLSGAAHRAGEAPKYDQFDVPEFLGPSAPKVDTNGICWSELAVQGLHCGACAWLIEKAAEHEPGLQLARVRMNDHTVRIAYDPKSTQLSSIARLFDRLGYRLTPLSSTPSEHIQAENRRQLSQIAIAGFCAANAMWIAVALYAGDFSGLAEEHRYFLGLIGTALGTASVLGPGRTFFIGAAASLRSSIPHMDLPVALGLGAGTCVGIINAVLGKGHVYFDSLAALVFLLLIGRWIQFRQQQRAVKAVDLMLRLTPRHATQVVDGEESTVLVDRLSEGDVVRVLAGENIPVDGCIIDGETQLDRSLLTGESKPIPVDVGDLVPAGSINLTARIDVRASAVGRNSRIGQVMQSVEAAASERTPIIQLADRIGGVFVVVVTMVAITTFAYWLPYGLNQATTNATAVLIVACPCALALATPLAIAVALGRAAKGSILIRDGAALQQLTQPGMLWFDKTGTLTEGRQRISHFIGDVQALADAAAIETHSSHPIARAVEREAALRRLEVPESGRLVSTCEGGVLGSVAMPSSGRSADPVASRQVAIGNEPLMLRLGHKIDDNILEQTREWLCRGESPNYISIDGEVVAAFGVSDPIREGAAELVEHLRKMGWRVGMLSGDHADIASKVAEQIGIRISDCHGGLTPEQKLAAIRESHQTYQSVVMVGDGANDAAALAAADVGIAVRGGAEVSLQAAPIFIASGQLSSIRNLIVGARRTTRLIYLSFGTSLAYNLVAVALAVGGIISPLVAAVLMPLSSVSVLAMSFSFRTFEVEQARRAAVDKLAFADPKIKVIQYTSGVST